MKIRRNQNVGVIISAKAYQVIAKIIGVAAASISSISNGGIVMRQAASYHGIWYQARVARL